MRILAMFSFEFRGGWKNYYKRNKQTTRLWSTATVERRQSKMAAPAEFKAENDSYSHAILKLIKNIFGVFFYESSI